MCTSELKCVYPSRSALVSRRQVSTPELCCAACAVNASCYGWTFHPDLGNQCLLTASPRTATGRTGTINATCGCRRADCSGAPPPPPGPPAVCEPVWRPQAPTLVPAVPGAPPRPHLVSIIVDDLGYDDTSINGNPGVDFTPRIHALMEQGVKLDRHHTYLWCSPTRRAFLSGRYVTHITGTQAPQCSNFLPLQFTILSEKLKAADYQSHFIGKGHLGVQTVDHLPANRGFETHVGYLGGGESYKWGGVYGSSINPAEVKHHDMWHTHQPATELIDQIDYSTSFYTGLAVDMIKARNTSRPFWLHLAFQAVHGGDWRDHVPPADAIPAAGKAGLYPHFQHGNYGSATRALDDGVGNITDTIKAAGMWDNTLLLLTSDNGGDCGLPRNPGRPSAPSQPGSASNYPLLGRKCTAFEGGTRVAAFITGGRVPLARRGTVSNQLIYITDWYHREPDPSITKMLTRSRAV